MDSVAEAPLVRNPAWRDLYGLIRESGYCITSEFFHHLVRTIMVKHDSKADVAALWALFKEMRRDHRQASTAVAVAGVLGFYAAMHDVRHPVHPGQVTAIQFPFTLASCLPAVSLRLLMVYRKLAGSPAARQQAMVDFANTVLLRRRQRAATASKNVHLR